jgi:predicted DNA-binding protein (MmcQ/YjbR family)
MADPVDRLRKICLALPDAAETENFGHPFFRFRKKPFCVYNGEKATPAVSFKVLKTEQGMFLEDPRFYKTPYVGQHGWVSLRLSGRLSWKEIEELVQASYHLVSQGASGKPR